MAEQNEAAADVLEGTADTQFTDSQMYQFGVPPRPLCPQAQGIPEKSVLCSRQRSDILFPPTRSSPILCVIQAKQMPSNGARLL